MYIIAPVKGHGLRLRKGFPMLYFVAFVWLSSLLFYWRIWRNWRMLSKKPTGVERFSLALDCAVGLLFLAFSLMLTVNTIRGEFQLRDPAPGLNRGGPQTPTGKS